MAALPFRNSVFSIDLEGRYIKEMLEHSVKDYNPRDLAGKFIQMSGTLDQPIRAVTKYVNINARM